MTAFDKAATGGAARFNDVWCNCAPKAYYPSMLNVWCNCAPKVAYYPSTLNVTAFGNGLWDCWVVGLLDCGIAGLQGCYSAVTAFDKAATGGAAHFNTKRVVQLRPKGGALPFNAKRDCVWQWIVGLLDCGIAGLWDCWIAGLPLCCDCV